MIKYIMYGFDHITDILTSLSGWDIVMIITSMIIGFLCLI